MLLLRFRPTTSNRRPDRAPVWYFTRRRLPIGPKNADSSRSAHQRGYRRAWPPNPGATPFISPQVFARYRHRPSARIDFMAVIEHQARAKLTPNGYPAILSVMPIIAGLGYVAAYPLLDWLSYVEPFEGLDITPWNPQVGLSFPLVLLFGRRTIPFLFIAPLVSHLLLNFSPVDLKEGIAHATVIGGGYSAAALFLIRPATRFDPALPSTRDLILLMLTALVSSAFVAVGYVATTTLSGYLELQDFIEAMLSYWVGDLIGIMVVTPFVLVALLRKHSVQMSLEVVLQFAAIVGALVLVLGVREAAPLQLFYVLFLPIVWMALRGGLEGVTIGLLLTQLGLIVGVTLSPQPEGFTALQTLMLVLTATGLIAGELVTEHRRAEAKLLLQQKALARVAQVGGMKELSVAIAHELNQPLTAARTYARLVADAAREDGANSIDIAEIAAKAVAQVERAAQVVRSLRSLLSLDRGDRLACSVERLIREALALCEPELDQVNAKIRVAAPSRLPAVLVDALQIEQTLLNLIRNSIDAFKAASISGGAISIEAVAAGEGFVEIRVADNGPGFATDVSENQFLPFSTTKAEGLGFGLVLCKTIVEAHGGRIWLSHAIRGASVHFTLPALDAPNE
jgi:signal transduction histidine kinase